MIRLASEQGDVLLAKSVVARVVTETARSFGGRVLFSNSRGKPLRVGNSGRENLSFVEIEESDEGSLDIHFYVVIRFGTSIQSLKAELGPAIRGNVKKVTGLDVDKLTMTITGVKSKNIGKRQLEIRM